MWGCPSSIEVNSLKGSLSVKTTIKSRDCLGRKIGLISVRLSSVLFLEWRCSVNANACGSGCSQGVVFPEVNGTQEGGSGSNPLVGESSSAFSCPCDLAHSQLLSGVRHALSKDNRKGSFVVPEFPTLVGMETVAPLLGRGGDGGEKSRKQTD